MTDNDDLELPDFLKRTAAEPAPADGPEHPSKYDDEDTFGDFAEPPPPDGDDSGIPNEAEEEPVDIFEGAPYGAPIFEPAPAPDAPASEPKAKKGKVEEPAPGIGHNSGPNLIARGQLKSIVERIERLNEEKAALAEDIKEVFMEAKANGYDTKTLRRIIALRKQDSAERQEQEALLDLYMFALGMAPATEADE